MTKGLDAKIRAARENGYDDVQIADYLSNNGMGDQINEARASGHSYNDIVRHLSGEKRGFVERIKQGAAGAYLGTGQMGSYLAEKTGLGDITIGTDGINYLSPEESKQRREQMEMGISELNIEKGTPEFMESLNIALGDPSMWAGAGYGGGLMKQGLQAGGLYEVVQPQDGEFDPVEKAKDTVTMMGVGAVAAPVAGAVIDKGMKYAPSALITKGGKEVSKRAGAALNESGAMKRASNRVKGLVADPEDVAARLDGETLSGLSAARQSGEEGLIGLENAVRKTSPELEKQFAQGEQRSRGILRQEAEKLGGGSAGKTTEFIEGRRSALVEKLNKRAEEATLRAQERIAKLSPKMRESEASLIVREELETALRTAKAEESQLWRNVPKAGLTTQGIKKKFAETIKNTPKAQLEDIPESAKKLLGRGGLKNIESATELQGLRSKLLEEAREASANGKYNKARMADDLANAVLDDLGAQAGNIRGEVGESLRRALDYSRNLNETFRQGNVGKVIAPDRLGGDRVASELTLGNTVGRGGVRGSVAIDEISKAAPRASDGVRDYVLQQFNRTAVKDGQVNAKAAEKFLTENADSLDKFPEIKTAIQDAVSSQGVAAARTDRAKRVSSALFSKQKSAAAEYLGAPVEKEFQRIVSAQNPAKLALEIKKMAGKDKSGEAVKGLKSGVVDYMLSKASSGADEAGNLVISGNSLKAMIRDKRTGAAIRSILEPDELVHLNKIADEFALLEKQGTNVGSVIDDNPNKLMNMAARVAGAKAGAKLGGGDAGASLQAAAIGSSNAKQYLKKFINDKAEELLIQSVQDKTLRRLLTANLDTPAKEVAVAKELSRWAKMNKGFMAIPVVDSMSEDGQENPPQVEMEPMGYTESRPVELKREAPESSLFQRVIQQESGGKQFDKNGNPLRSKAGAVGIAQVMPKTAPEAAKLAGLPFDEKRYLNDAEYNAALGEAYLNKKLEEFDGDETLALMAYNWGSGNVRGWLKRGADPKVIPKETRNYVKKILGKEA